MLAQQQVDFATLSNDIQKALDSTKHSHGSIWRTLVSTVTFFLPDGALRTFGVSSEARRVLWRDKLVTWILFLLLQLALVWSIYRAVFVSCVPGEPTISHLDARSLQRSILINGFVFDPPEELGYADLIGKIANSKFATRLDMCPETLPSSAHCFGQGRRRCRKLAPLKKYTLGYVSFPWSAVENSNALMVFRGMVLDTHIYFDRDKGFLGKQFNKLIAAHIGRDVTRMALGDKHLADAVDCFSRLYRVGYIRGVGFACAASHAILSLMIALVLFLNMARVLYASISRIEARLSSRGDKSPSEERKARLLMLIRCPDDVEPLALRRTLDLLTQCREANVDGIFLIISDGSNARLREFLLATVQICEDEAEEPSHLHRGVYHCSSQRVPTLWIEDHDGKLHTMTSAMGLLLKALSDDAVHNTSLALAASIQQSFRRLLGADMDSIDYLLVTQGGTQVRTGAVRSLVMAMERDPWAVAARGNSKAGNRKDSLFTRLQSLGHRMRTTYLDSIESAHGHCRRLDENLSIFRLRPRHQAAGDSALPTMLQPWLIRSLEGESGGRSLCRCYTEEEFEYFLPRLLSCHLPASRILFVPRAGCLVSLPDHARDFVRHQAREYLRNLYNLMRDVVGSNRWGFLRLNPNATAFLALMETLISPAVFLFLGYLAIFAITRGDMTMPAVLFLCFGVLLFALPVLLTLLLGGGGVMSHGCEAILHLAALPFYSLTLPIYAVWTSDTFIRYSDDPNKA